ncbi:MAG: RNA polymerase sigma factor [Bacillaceae bacterium]
MIDFEGRWIRKIQVHADQASANKLIKKYYEEMYVFVYKQMLDKQLSLDLTQEIFIRMLQSIQHFDSNKSKFRTWLYRIATNHCIDYFRSKQYQAGQHIDIVENIEIAGTNEVEKTLSYKEDYEAVQQLLCKLPEQIQQIVRYKLFLDYTFAEIGEILHMPQSTVKTNFYKAMRNLRKEMEAYFYEENEISY